MSKSRPDWLTAKSTEPTIPTYAVPILNRNRMAVGLDTETTGLYTPKYNPYTGKRYKDSDPPKYCYPYLVCFVYYRGKHRVRVEHYYEFPIDATTRLPLPFTDDEYDNLNEIYAILHNQDVYFVGHNISFDLSMIYALFTLVPPSVRKAKYPRMSMEFIYNLLLYKSDDTSLMYHAIDSALTLELKPIATRYAGIPDTDEQDLKSAVDKIRKVIETSGLTDKVRIASLKSIPYLTRPPKRGWYILDTWLGVAPNLPSDIQPLADTVRKLSIEYCLMDCWRTLSLHTIALETFERPPSNHEHLLNQYEINRTSIFTTTYLGTIGVAIHYDYLESHIKSLSSQISSLSKTIYKIAAKYLSTPRNPKMPWIDPPPFQFNPNSDAQLSLLIHTHLACPCSKYTESGKPSMKIENLIDLLTLDIHPDARKIIECIIALKKYEKALSMEESYRIKSCGGRLFSSYNPTGTVTLRLASYDPNGQNIGKGQIKKEIAALVTESVSLRPIFGPPTGREWYSVDYVQLQLIIFAMVTNDPEMRKAVDEQRDIHDFMARKIFDTPSNQSPSDGERRIAKAVNFGYIFGAGEREVEATAKIKGLFDLLRMLFPTASNTIASNKRIADRDGYICTNGGYPLRVPYQKPHAATNYIIQGTEGELVKYALFCCVRYLMEYVFNSFLTIIIHDELVFDFPMGEGIKHMPTLIKFMTNAGDYTIGRGHLLPPVTTIPLRVDVKYIPEGKGWHEGQLVEF